MIERDFSSSVRKKIVQIIITGFFALLVFQLFQMQILKKYSYQEKSDENSIKSIVQNAPRGIFFDRNFNVLVSNKPSFTLQITPSDYNDKNSVLIEKMMEVDSGYIEKILAQNKMFSKYVPRKIKRDVDFKVIAWLEENAEKLPGVDYTIEMQRDYSFGILGSHIFGYMKEIDARQLQQKKDDYDMGDYIGASGIEKTYEDYLRGQKGYDFILVDSKRKTIGRYLEGQADTPAQKGDDLVLTIDAETQKAAEKLFFGKKGALVAVEPATGEIIALVSAPEYNLDNFASVTSEDFWNELTTNPAKPLFNRATMSIYAPGSTYKMLEAVMALEEGVISRYTTINCKGGYQFGNRYFRCDHIHGRVDVIESIQKSCNTFFYPLVYKTGFGKWVGYSKEFGFGQKTGLDIPEESAGIIPSPEYYDKIYGKRRWTDGNLFSLAIGQGELSTTPVQLAQYTALLANFGKSGKPHLVKGMIDSKSNAFIPFEFEKISIDIKNEIFDIVRTGMFKVVNSDEGTARNIRNDDIHIAGKTGTAQNPHGENHALFIAFAPYEDPQIAVAVIVENAGYGSTHAAPIARDVILTFLNKKSELKDSQIITSLLDKEEKKSED